jgi:hypothetical protein
LCGSLDLGAVTGWKIIFEHSVSTGNIMSDLIVKIFQADITEAEENL